MTRWTCGIAGCGARYEVVEDLISHQATGHPDCECRVCGSRIPEGYLAIHHAFEEHTRAEYVRAYDADSDAVRERENIKEEVEGRVDVEAVLDRLDDGADRSPVSAD